MAKVIRKFVFSAKRGCTAKYPWDQWLDGQVWQLTHGEDFSPEVKYMRSAACRAASNRGGKVRTTADGEKLVIQFYRENGKEG